MIAEFVNDVMEVEGEMRVDEAGTVAALRGMIDRASRGRFLVVGPPPAVNGYCSLPATTCESSTVISAPPGSAASRSPELAGPGDLQADPRTERHHRGFANRIPGRQ